MNALKRHILICLLLAIFSAGSTSRAQAQEADYKAYTLFLYNFMKYVEWPAPGDNFVVGVVGDSPIMKELTYLAANKKVKGKNIVIKTLSNLDDAAGCQLVFIPAAKSSQTRLIADKVKGKSVLLIGEREGMARKGAAISFVIEDDDSLKFDINKSVLEGNHLKVANVLMELGSVI